MKESLGVYKMIIQILKLIWAIVGFVVVVLVVLFNVITGLGEKAKKELIDSFIKNCLFIL